MIRHVASEDLMYAKVVDTLDNSHWAPKNIQTYALDASMTFEMVLVRWLRVLQIERISNFVQ